VAAASWKVRGRPVRLAFSRAEEFYTICRHAATVHLSTGVLDNGTICARKVEVLWSAGAYADISPRVAKNGGYAAIGPYRVPHVAVDSYAVYTNVTPAGGFRGYGVPQVAWAYESQLDEIAHQLGVDRWEIRRRNLLRDGDLFSTGQVMTDLHYAELLSDVTERLRSPTRSSAPPRVSRPSGALRRGTGVAITAKGTVTPSTSSATLRVERDGSVVLLAGTSEIGQGARTSLCQIAADALGVPFEAVQPVHPDTQLMPWDQAAAAEVRDDLLDLGAGLLGVPRSEVECLGGGVQVHGTPSSRLTFADIIARRGVGGIVGSGVWITEGHLDSDTGLGVATSALFQGAAGAEVEVDVETGKVRVLGLHVAVWTGRVVHPTFAELQCEGNVAFGIGAALFEEMVVVDGQVANASLADYMIASFEDMPQRIEVALLESAESGARLYGLGESALPPIAPAIANAVRDACGVRIDSLPITPEKVLRALSATVNHSDREGNSS
jgi:CO/xanthine dehydrogenase Mo-binding subunit